MSDAAEFWWERLEKCPAVYCLLYVDPQGEGVLQSIHDSEETAQVALDWWKSRGYEKSFYIGKWNIHTLELARERWHP